MQMINNFEAGLGRMQVYRRDAAQADELLGVLEIPAQIDDARRVRNRCRFAEGLSGFEDGGVIHLETSFLSTAQSSAPFFQT